MHTGDCSINGRHFHKSYEIFVASDQFLLKNARPKGLFGFPVSISKPFVPVCYAIENVSFERLNDISLVVVLK